MPRTREFDTDATLDSCMKLFWAKGFAGVSVSDLEAATGLGRQSLYSAFGNKEAIFDTVLERYTQATEAWLAPLLAESAGIDDLLQYAKDGLSAQRTSKCSGCLVVKVLWDSGIEDEAVQKRAKAATKRVRAAFENCLQRSQDRGEATPGDIAQRADLCFATLNGLAALRRADVSERRALETFEQLLDSFRT